MTQKVGYVTQVIGPVVDVIFEGEVQMVKLPGTVGQFTVLENHAPLVSTLTPGEIIYKGVEEEKSVQICGGVVEVRDNNVVVCIN